MNRIQKIKGISLICLLILFFLSGCTLAKEGTDEGGSRDQLIGGLLTRVPIEKTYATVEAPMEDGYLWGMEFGDICGTYFFYHEEVLEDEEVILAVYNGSSANLNETNARYKNGEGGQEIDLSAKRYVVPEQGEEILSLYLNPMYKTKDNKIYVLPGDGESVYVGSSTAQSGVKMQLSVSEENRFTLGGSETIDRVCVTCEVEVMYLPVRTTVVQFNGKNQALDVKEYLPEAVPRNIEALPETEYVMIETELLKPDGTNVKQRETYQWEGEIRTTEDKNGKVTDEQKETSVFLYQADENGFLKKEIYFILWTEKEL